MKAEDILAILNLAPLPFEGGFYRETYRTQETAVPARLSGVARELGRRSYGTCIYYLLTKEQFSAFHLVESDEMFHFYCGDSVELVMLGDQGPVVKCLGNALLAGERPQILVPQGTWQGLRLKPGGNWALLGCTVSPGFDFADFRLGSRAELLQMSSSQQWSMAKRKECEEWIQILTRE